MACQNYARGFLRALSYPRHISLVRIDDLERRDGVTVLAARTVTAGAAPCARLAGRCRAVCTSRYRRPRWSNTITVAPDACWLGTEQVFSMKPDGDRLTLYGTALVGRPRRRALERRRCRG